MISSLTSAILGFLGVGLASWLTFLSSGNRSLSERINRLENRIQELEAAREEDEKLIKLLVSFINRLGLWLMAGRKSCCPEPDPKIYDYIDTQLWTALADQKEHFQ